VLRKIKIFILVFLYLGTIFGDTIIINHSIENNRTSHNLFIYQNQEKVKGKFLGVYKKIVFVSLDDNSIKKYRCEDVERISSDTGDILFNCEQNNESLKELYNKEVENKSIISNVAIFTIPIIAVGIYSFFANFTDGNPWD